ncbi:MAG: M20 family metallopeptidase [Deltaproteobacteria bacterium]|nr:M20 family metallopeptidase [Deltaproteobacteria bacterium]
MASNVRSAMDTREQELLPLLERWVRTNSYTANIEGVNAMGELLVEAFDLPGLEHAKIAGEELADHHWWKTPAFEPGGGGVMLVGHHDTVFPPGTFDVFERDGDRLRGPGVLDMKGGLATVRTALAALADAGELAAIPVAVVSVGDEEIGSVESKPHLQGLARGASVGLVFEAGRTADRIITRRKGTGALAITVHGKAAHAGNHHADGVNAIWVLARLILQIEELTDYERGVTLNVGLAKGGEARNTVPPLAECSVDMRFESSADGESTVTRVRELASRLSQETGASIEVDGGVRREPLERSDGSARLYQEYAACADAAGLGSEESPPLGGGSDANTLSSVGVPAIDGLGPRGLGFHTKDEFIEVSTLPLRVEALVRFLLGRRG